MKIINKRLQLNSESTLKWRIMIYSILFFFAAFFIFLPYWTNGRSLICSGDAVQQHFPALAYYGEYLRNIFSTLWNEHRLDIPMWDMGIGYGGDIITTLHYYCLGDPLTLLSIFFKEEYTELCYTLLIFIRLYLSGLGMLWYCNHHKIKGYSSVIGALIYCFSGYAVSAGVFHPFFSVPMIYLPLLLLGIDYLYEGKTPFLFIITVALALLSNFYFFYMLVIFAVLYAVLRYFSYFKNFKILHCLKWIFKFIANAVIGLLLAMPVFLPNLISLLQSDRIYLSREIPAFYPLDYYKSIPYATVSEYGEYYVYIAVSVVAIACVFLLFTFPLKENKSLVISYIVLFAFLLFPIIGSVFNGFNYVTNRWIWALTFLLGFITAKILPKAEKLTKKQFIKLSVLISLFCIICLLPPEARSTQTIVALSVMILCLILIALSSLRFISSGVFRSVITLVVVFTVVANGYFHASPKHNNWAGNSQEIGAAYSRYYESEMKTVDTLSNAGTTRVDVNKNCLDSNASLMYKTGGTGFYFSTINPGTALFQRTQMLNSAIDQQYNGLDGRSYLAAALSVSYYISDTTGKVARPFGYDIPVADSIYTSEHTLPLVYVFDSICTQSKNMTVTQKQQALLQCAMTTENYDLPESTPIYTDYELPYNVVSSDGIEITDKEFKVQKDAATLKLSFAEVRDCELYCIIEDLDFKPISDITETILSFSDSILSPRLLYKTDMNNYSSGKHGFLVNFGYQEKERTEISITFPSAGVFTFSDFSIVAQPLNNLHTQIDTLANSGISNIAVNGDIINFTSDRSSAGIACISIPYQKGWTATVDGKENSIVCIQEGLCGLYLDSGHHEIILNYRTPFCVFSWYLFGLGLLLCAILFIIQQRKYNFFGKKGGKLP